MKTIAHSSSRILCGAILVGTLLSGCASKGEVATLYDFGPLHAASNVTQVPAISIAEVNSPAWLDGTLMFYRLAYTNELQPRPYANSRWTMTPSQLLGHRLKGRIAQGGGAVLSAIDGASNLPLLRVEIDDFSQSFESAKSSTALVTVRASLFQGRSLVAQKTFSQTTTTASADAAGGARALAASSDALITDIIAWLVVKK